MLSSLKAFARSKTTLITIKSKNSLICIIRARMITLMSRLVISLQNTWTTIASKSHWLWKRNAWIWITRRRALNSWLV